MIRLLLFLGILALPYNNFPFIAGGTLKPLSAPILILAAAALVLAQTLPKVPRSRTDVWLLTFLGWALFCGLANLILGHPASAKPLISPFSRFAQFMAYGLITFGTYLCGRASVLFFRRRSILVLLAMAFIPSLLAGVMQGVTQNGSFITALRKLFATTNFGTGYYRLPLLTLEPSWAGLDLGCVLIPLGAALFDHRRKATYKYLGFSLFGIILLMMTHSITAIACFALTAAYWILRGFQVSLQKRGRLIPIILGVSTLLILSLGLFKGLSSAAPQEQGAVSTRLSSLFQSADNSEPSKGPESAKIEESSATRILSQWAGIQIGMNHPLLGIGPRNFGYYYRDYLPKVYTVDTLISDYIDPASKRFADVKGTYSDVFCSTGFPGLVLWLLLSWSLLRKVDSSINDTRILWWIVLVFQVAGLGCSLFAYPWYWFIAGCLVSAKALPIETERHFATTTTTGSTPSLEIAP